MKKTKRILLGAVIALAVYLALLAALSLLIVRGSAQEAWTGTCVWIFACAASCAGAAAAARGEMQPLCAASLCALAFWVMILLLGFLVNDALDAARFAGSSIPIFAGAAFACLPGGRGKRSKKRRGRYVHK